MTISRVAGRHAGVDLTEGDVKALRLLVSFQGRLIGPGAFGDTLWGRRDRGGSNCSCPYARPAGKVLNRLKRAALAEWVHEGNNWGWRALPAAYELLRVKPL
jgi:hypothetical protein